ncbi:uncharacterized protein LOC128300600 [Anopheles moucheti]|uniref:uncharacterized protein LOC128300600 n=1 Tax=Anopheles moucheti TaxID=186751 RepID=UPI0022F12E74|nr:uncharacterized protein LOC128300600 [Anopheles moucheti]
MVLSVLMVQTLTTLLEPPPAIGGTKGLSPTGQPHQPQANIAVFMFLFMLCAAEVVFIKLLALTSFGSGDVLTATTATAANGNATSSTATQTTSTNGDQPTVAEQSSSSTGQE